MSDSIPNNPAPAPTPTPTPTLGTLLMEKLAVPTHAIGKHLFVSNPLTGKLIDILPMLELIHLYGDADGMREAIQDIHDFMSVAVIEDVVQVDFVTANHALIQLRKTFARMTELSL